MLVQINDVSKSFGSQSVLRDVSFQINPSEKIGLIGANGAGKTTLLKIIDGNCEPDVGIVARKSGLRIGVLDQIPEFSAEASVLEEALRMSDDLRDKERQMRKLEHAIASDPRPDMLDRYAKLQHEFEFQGGYGYTARTEAALLGVGFLKDAFNRPSSELSGGEKNRLALAKLLLSNSELLLLDEPTNHLDIRATEWLEKFLKETDNTVVVISHDRLFLDRVVSRIIEVVDTKTEVYQGNYSDYMKERAVRLERQEREWRRQTEWIEKQQDYIRRNIAGQKTKQAQSRRKLLARVQPIAKPRTSSSRVRFKFRTADRTGRYVLTTRNLGIGYTDEPLVSSIQFEIQRGERWAILGPNGAGKTTLLRTLIGAVSPLEGELEWNGSLDVGYYDQQLQDLDPQATVLEEIRELDLTATDGELRSYLAQFLFSEDDVFKHIHQLSGGERSRVTLARIIYARPQLLALDEPTNHLDISSREALEEALLQYPGTILFVTHDRYLVQKIATHLLYLERGQAFMFDRISAFEEWLQSAPEIESPTRPSPVGVACKENRASAKSPGLSKNKVEQLQREIAELERQISSAEAELSEMERSFQEPQPGLDWKSVHHKYDQLKRDLEHQYGQLAIRLELIG